MRRLCSSTCSPSFTWSRGRDDDSLPIIMREEKRNGGGKKRRLFPPRALRLHVVYYEEGRRNSLPAVDDPPLRKNDALPPLYTRVSVHEFILARFLATFEAVATRGISISMVFLVEMELGFDSSLDFGNVWRSSS